MSGGHFLIPGIVKEDTEMTRYLIFLLILLSITACVSIDLSPHPVTSASDPAWIRKFDAKLMDAEAKSITGHNGSIDSKIKLWESLNCLRGVYIARLRAAEAISKTQRISRSSAIEITITDPLWTMAEQQCR